VRLGAEGDTLEAQLTRFKARLSPLSGHVDPAAAAAVLERAADDIEHLNPTHTRKTRKHHAG
jgi:hypothetical protein